MALAFSFLQSASSTTDTNAYTFSAQSLGAAASDRYIIVGSVARKAGASTTLSSISIGGVTATIINQITNTVTNTDVAGLTIALVPSGTTGDVVVTWGATMVRSAIGMWRVTGMPDLSPYDSQTSTANAPSVSLNIPAGGFGVGMALTAANSSSTAAGLTEDFDAVVEALVTYTGGSLAPTLTQSTLTCSFTFGSTTEPAGVFASWPPFNLKFNNYMSIDASTSNTGIISIGEKIR